MITNVSALELRGRNFDYELGEKTIIVGRNGSGKSSVSAAINLAILGFIPGSDKKGSIVFQNASASTMLAAVQINGKKICRTWQQGKTLQERIAIDGAEAPKSAAQAMLEMAIGKEPVVIDTTAFFDATPKEQRRMLLRMVADEKTLKELADAEETARDRKNAKTRERQVADKAVENLTLSLAKTEKPTGDLSRIEADIQAIEKERSELQKRIADGEANDKVRKGVEGTLASIEGMEKKLAEAQEELKSYKSDVKTCEEEASKIGGMEQPTKEMYDLPEKVIEVIKKAVEDLKDIDVDEGRKEIEDVAILLSSLLESDDSEYDKKVEAYNAWGKAYRGTQQRLLASRDGVSMSERNIAKLKGQIQEAKKADKKLDKIGPGPDQKDVAAFAGLQTRLTELRAKQKPLIEFQAIQKEMEKSRIQAQKASEAEETAKEELGKAIKAQKDVVTKASELLGERSKSVLPTGELYITDDDSGLSIAWKRGDLIVNRRTLSGGEKAIFDSALGYSLAPAAMIIIEAAEVDDFNMIKLMDHLTGVKCQVVLLTCHDDYWYDHAKGSGWTVIEIEAAK